MNEERVQGYTCTHTWMTRSATRAALHLKIPTSSAHLLFLLALLFSHFLSLSPSFSLAVHTPWVYTYTDGRLDTRALSQLTLISLQNTRGNSLKVPAAEPATCIFPGYWNIIARLAVSKRWVRTAELMLFSFIAWISAFNEIPYNLKPYIL